MKSILLLLLIIFSNQAYSFEGCYEANTNYEGNQNTWTICKETNNKISLEIYFSNNLTDSGPTTCTEIAEFVQQNNTIKIKGERGVCDNGRHLIPHNLKCTKSNSGYNCYLENYSYKIIFIEKHNKALKPGTPQSSAP